MVEPSRGIPETWLLPPAPREPELAARWWALDPERRQQLAWLEPEEVREADDRGERMLSEDERPVVAALARARLATTSRLLIGPVVLGWLVLMTVWGFGRSTAPEAQEGYLMAGVALGAVVWLVAAFRGLRLLRRARLLLAVTSSRPSEAEDPEVIERWYEVDDDLDD